MLSTLLKKRKVQKEPNKTKPSKYLVSKTGDELLKTNNRQAYIVKIKRTFSVTDDVWAEHYLYAIHQFLEFAQELPASEIHHHSQEGGLIDHTLEAVFAGVRIAQGYILPPNAEPEQIHANSDRWRFGIFVSILAHDLGKIVTDLEVVHRAGEGDFQKWHPWNGKIPINNEYVFRYKQRLENAKVSKSMHEKASISLLPHLLTDKATFWLFEDQDLISQVLNTVSHATFGGGTVAEIVRKADSSSVSSNLGADTGKNSDYSPAIPLHEKLVMSLRKLISDGELKRNRPGAALWVTEKHTWVVSKAVMEAVQAQLKNEGHKGIPSNVVRLYETLREHDHIIPNPEGNSVWTAKVKDFNFKWNQKLTFLRFDNGLLWPTSDPEKFCGEITPLDRDGNECIEDNGDENDSEEQSLPTNETSPPDVSKPEVKTPTPIEEESNSTSKNSEKNGNNDQTARQTLDQLKHKPKKPISQKEKVTPKKDHNVDHEVKVPNQLPFIADQWSKNANDEEVKHARSHSFFAWLLRGIKKKNIRVNEPLALVHIVDNYVALVTPEVFTKYLTKESQMKVALYKSKAKGKQPYVAVQKEVEALGINKKSMQGENIHHMTVEGPKNQAALKVYLFERKIFPELDNFAPNKAMSVEIK